jgi:hypothetical protein
VPNADVSQGNKTTDVSNVPAHAFVGGKILPRHKNASGIFSKTARL